MRNRHQRTIRTILPNHCRQLLYRLVGKCVGKDSNIETAGADGIHRLCPVLRGDHLETTVAQYLRPIQRQFPNAAKHQHSIAVADAPKRLTPFGRVERRIILNLSLACMDGQCIPQDSGLLRALGDEKGCHKRRSISQIVPDESTPAPSADLSFLSLLGPHLIPPCDWELLRLPLHR